MGWLTDIATSFHIVVSIGSELGYCRRCGFAVEAIEQTAYDCLSKRNVNCPPGMAGAFEELFEYAIGQVQPHGLWRLAPIFRPSIAVRAGDIKCETGVGDGESSHVSSDITFAIVTEVMLSGQPGHSRRSELLPQSATIVEVHLLTHEKQVRW